MVTFLYYLNFYPHSSLILDFCFNLHCLPPALVKVLFEGNHEYVDKYVDTDLSFIGWIHENWSEYKSFP